MRRSPESSLEIVTRDNPVPILTIPQMRDAPLGAAIDSIPAGDWAVGVSGGADSVALLHLLRSRGDLRLVVAHLNHQLRGLESDADAAFVETVCARLGVPCETATRKHVEAACDPKALPRNPSAKYRRLRFKHFAGVVRSNNLRGVILAHHADDQAETILQRLLRGGELPSLAGMRAQSTIHGVTVVRPLLNVRREVLRRWLRNQNEAWREDASNASPIYLRNRLRQSLRACDLTEDLLELSTASAAVRDWIATLAPRLREEFPVRALHRIPRLLAHYAARRWLRTAGVPPESIDHKTVRRFLLMSEDAGSPAAQQFPGSITVRRRAGKIFRA